MQYASQFQVAVALTVILARNEVVALVALPELHLGVAYLHLYLYRHRRLFEHIIRLVVVLGFADVSLAEAEGKYGLLVAFSLKKSPGEVVCHTGQGLFNQFGPS